MRLMCVRGGGGACVEVCGEVCVWGGGVYVCGVCAHVGVCEGVCMG